MTGKAYGYVRVSHLHQVESGLSLEYQEETIRKYFEFWLQSKYAWGEMFIEKGVSATKRFTSRPQGARLNLVLTKGDCVIMTRLDRGFRNLVDCVVTYEAWKQRGVDIHLLDLKIDSSSAAGKMMLNLVAAISQYESDIKSERVREAHARMRARGHCLPLSHYGKVGIQDEHGHYILHDCPEERAHARAFLYLRKQGWSYHHIYTKCCVENWQNKFGKRYTFGKIFRMMRDELIQQELDKQAGVSAPRCGWHGKCRPRLIN